MLEKSTLYMITYILDEDAQYKKMIEEKLKKVGFEIEITRGDNPDFVEKL